MLTYGRWILMLYRFDWIGKIKNIFENVCNYPLRYCKYGARNQPWTIEVQLAPKVVILGYIVSPYIWNFDLHPHTSRDLNHVMKNRSDAMIIHTSDVINIRAQSGYWARKTTCQQSHVCVRILYVLGSLSHSAPSPLTAALQRTFTSCNFTVSSCCFSSLMYCFSVL